MTTRTRRLAVLGALGVAAVMVFTRLSAGPQVERAQQASSAAATGDQRGSVAVPVVDLNLERLRRGGGEFPDPERNPFRFRPAAPPPASARAAVERPPTPPDELVPPRPTGPPPPPPIPVKFFGLLVLRGERVATFVDARGNTFYGREGDIIEGRYRVLRIGTDTVDLAHLDGRGRQTIRLTGQ